MQSDLRLTLPLRAAAGLARWRGRGRVSPTHVAQRTRQRGQPVPGPRIVAGGLALPVPGPRIVAGGLALPGLDGAAGAARRTGSGRERRAADLPPDARAAPVAVRAGVPQLPRRLDERAKRGERERAADGDPGHAEVG